MPHPDIFKENSGIDLDPEQMVPRPAVEDDKHTGAEWATKAAENAKP